MTTHEVRTYEAASAALRSPALRQALYRETATLLGSAVINLHGAQHQARRDAESRIFRKDFFKHYEADVLAPEMEATLAPCIRSGKADLFDLGYRMMVNLTADFAGIDRAGRTVEATADLVRLLKAFALAAVLDQSTLGDVAEIKAKLLAAIGEFRDRYLRPSMGRRLRVIKEIESGRAPESGLPRDIMSILLREKEKLGMGPDEMLQESIFFLVAGAHTSVHTLTHAVHEIFRWLQVYPEDWSRVKADPFFIQRCVREAVRLHPSSPVAKRQAQSAVTLPHIGRIGREDEIVIYLEEANRDTDIFGPDAGDFNPDRFIPAGKAQYGLSMGMGMHTCLGLNLALGGAPSKGADPASHHFGTVSRIVSALFRAGMRPDPAGAPRKDPTTTRALWAYYPVVFEESR